MPLPRFYIDPDIRKASTMDTAFYLSEEIFEASKTELFQPFWQWVGVTHAVRAPGSVFPFTLLPDFLDEPLLLSRDESGNLNCISNVCTHRGNLLIGASGNCGEIKCKYHGRRFALNGKMVHMPGFESAEDFPSGEEDLTRLVTGNFGPFVFAAHRPRAEFSNWIQPLAELMNWAPVNALRLDSGRSKTYTVNAHWALYVENFLEGFHIPFVHSKSLAPAMDFAGYESRLYTWGTVQLARAKEGDPVLNLPETHPDFGKPVGAYYIWLFPNIMFNFYPWGLSIILVQPKGLEKTEIRYLTYVWNQHFLDKGLGNNLEQIEFEDEAVVENVQKGIKSSFYHRGRYSPVHERGVHHFHRLLAMIFSGGGE